MVDYYDDILFNYDLGINNAVRCHDNFDAAFSIFGDIVRTRTDTEYVLQKIYFWMSIKYGELLHHPEIGCSLHKFFHKKNTANNRLTLAMTLKYELQNQIPELGVQAVTVYTDEKTDTGHIDKAFIRIDSEYFGTMNLTVEQSTMVILEAENIFRRYLDNQDTGFGGDII